MKVNTAYIAYNGEQNPYGIGSPCIVLRLQGCHLRCYKNSLGTLCDTPEALDLHDSGKPEQTVSTVVERLKHLRATTGINLILLTGGDPLSRNQDELDELFYLLGVNSFKTTVETSGTLSPLRFMKYPCVSFILDRKLKSAAVKHNLVEDIALNLRDHDYIKYVVYDDADYFEMRESLLHVNMKNTKAKICAGVYWGGLISSSDLFNKMLGDGLFPQVDLLNMQAHKLITLAEEVPADLFYSVKIPTEI